MTLVRRPQPASPSPKVHEQVIDFEQIGASSVSLRGDQLFSALGTTIKVAGSQEAFRRVDFDFPLQLATRARTDGVHHFLLVSALGATASSRVFYNRVKGELEDAVAALGFRSLTIARPSLLLGNRAEYRRGEEIGRHFAFLAPRRWKPVDVRQVASALVHAAKEDAPGTRILENRDLLEFPIT
jgi:uncharacterized protein YbjT (DUF2867 family)